MVRMSPFTYTAPLTIMNAENTSQLSSVDIDAWIGRETTPLWPPVSTYSNTNMFTLDELRGITSLYTECNFDRDTITDAHNTWLELGIYQDEKMTVAYGDWLKWVLHDKPNDFQQMCIETIMELHNIVQDSAEAQ